MDGISKEEAKKAIGKNVLIDWEQNQGANLRKVLKEKEQTLKRVKDELNDLRRENNSSRRMRREREGPGRFD